MSNQEPLDPAVAEKIQEAIALFAPADWQRQALTDVLTHLARRVVELTREQDAKIAEDAIQFSRRERLVALALAAAIRKGPGE